MRHTYGIMEAFIEDFENEPITEESLKSWWFYTMRYIVCPTIGEWYSLEFDNAKRRLACCKYVDKVVSVSRNYFEVADKKSLMNTLLHELSHAYAYEMDGETGHGKEWRAHMEAMGLDEEEITRCANEGVDGESLRRRDEKNPGKYEAYCPKCEAVCGHRWRLTKSMRANAIHNACRTKVVWTELC